MLASVIRLRRHWNGRAAGAIVSTLGSGVMQTLVDNHIAEWVKPEAEQERVERNVHNNRRTKRGANNS